MFLSIVPISDTIEVEVSHIVTIDLTFLFTIDQDLSIYVILFAKIGGIKLHVCLDIILFVLKFYLVNYLVTERSHEKP